MTHLDDHDDQFTVVDLVDDSVDPNPDPIQIVTGQLAAVRRARIVRELIDCVQNAPNGRPRQAAEILADRREKPNPVRLISCRRPQAASGVPHTRSAAPTGAPATRRYPPDPPPGADEAHR